MTPDARHLSLPRNPSIKRKRRWILIALWLFAAPGSSSAKLCGDAVEGRDVPCACGDTLVSDLVLGDDPVANAPCDQDGLIVRAANGDAGVRIDLRGKTLRGTGDGTGLWVVYGGPGGAHIVSSGGRALLEGFRDGITGHGPDTVALVDGVNITASRRDAMRVVSDGFEIRNSEARASGRDGFSVGGSRYRLLGTRAVDSKHFGYFLAGMDATVGEPGAGNAAQGSGEEGFSVMGMGHRLVECSASGSGKDGVHFNTMHVEVKGCSVTQNRGAGMAGMASGSTLTQNRATDNDGDGIHVGGPGVVDGGGNVGSGNGGDDQQQPVAQCEIAHAPCRL
jgi:hypothetical protein